MNGTSLINDARLLNSTDDNIVQLLLNSNIIVYYNTSTNEVQYQTLIDDSIAKEVVQEYFEHLNDLIQSDKI